MLKAMRALALLFLMLVALTGCSKDNSAQCMSTMIKVQDDTLHNMKRVQKKEQFYVRETDPIAETMRGMTIEEKIGQMVIVGMEGTALDDRAKTLIGEYYVGGVILFRRNIDNAEQLLQLTNDLKRENAVNAVPMLLSIDEEGGRISRLPRELLELPSNQVIGSYCSAEFSYEIGRVLAEELSAFGINMNFAPVLDIQSNPNNSVIGDRSFGSDAQIVSLLGTQTMNGIQDGGIISVVKHFPGHGDTAVDSHLGLPSLEHDMDRLQSVELMPFKKAIECGADAVMAGHILFHTIDAVNPASLSRTIITDILRKDLGYDGVVITDDMTMGAIVQHYELTEAAVEAVNAGCDIVLVCHGYQNEAAVLEALKAAVHNGTISQERIDESVYRILELKGKYAVNDACIDSVNVEKINVAIRAVLNAYADE